MMNKVTMRNTVAEIKEFINAAYKNRAVKADKDLRDRISYTSKAVKKGEKVAKKDLLDLATDCFTVMAAAETAKPEKESSLKKKPSTKATAEKKPEAKPVEDKKPAAKSDSKTTAKSDSKKKTTPKKDAPKKFSFPEEFKDEDGVKYVRADDLTNIDEVREAVADDEEIIVAVHWTEAMLKEGSYAIGQLPKSAIPKKFEGDLDLLTVIFVGEITDNILTVSMYTEALYYWTGKSLKQTKNGRKGYNLEFELYRAEDVEE